MRSGIWCLLLALAACDDSSTGSEGAGGAGGAGGMPILDMGPGGGGGGGAGGAPLDGRELELVGQRDVLVFTGQTARIDVRLVAGANRQPVANQNLEAGLLNADGQAANDVEGTTLRARRVATNADGIAGFEVVAGPRPTTLFVEFSGGDASAIRAQVVVAAEGQGALQVTVTYDPAAGRYAYGDFQEVRVDLFLADEVDCETLRGQASNPRGAYLGLPSISPFNEVDNQTTAPDVSEGQVFQVMATGIGPTGQTVSFGCTPNVAARGGQVVMATVAMTDLPLEFKGRFPAVSRFDLTGLLENSGDPSLARVAEVMGIIRILGNGNGDRGQELARLFCDVVQFDEGICTLLRRIGGPIVNEVFEMVVPDIVLELLTALSDLVGIFSEMTIVGEIEFINSFPDPTGIIAGNDDRWQKFRFVWNGETREFTFGDLGRDYRPVAGVFEGRVQDETLQIGSHGMTLKLGIIALGIVELWIAPRFLRNPPPVRLEDVLGAIIPCPAINDYIFDDPNNGLCEDVLVTALAELLVEQLQRLDLAPDAFRIEGTAKLRDTDGDLRIDRLEDGIWNGTLDVNGRAFAFPGCFTACRDNPCPEPACEIQP